MHAKKQTTILPSVNPNTLVKLEQAFGDGKIASFLYRDPDSSRQKKWIKYDERLEIVIGEYYSYST